MTRLLLVLLFVLLAPVTAQAGVAEQSSLRANAGCEQPHDVCEVHGNEKRRPPDAEDWRAYASILKPPQRSLMPKTTLRHIQVESGRGLQKP
jgi:hypothetical protein